MSGRLVISNLRQEDGYWKATVTRDEQVIDVDRRYGSWQTTVPKPVTSGVVHVRREVTRLVAQELQAKVLFLERRARKAAIA